MERVADVVRHRSNAGTDIADRISMYRHVKPKVLVPQIERVAKEVLKDLGRIQTLSLEEKGRRAGYLKECLRFAEGKPTLKDRLPLLGRTRHDALAEAFIRISGMHNELQALMRNPRRTS